MTEAPPGRPWRVLYVNHSGVPAGSVRSLRFLLQSFPPGIVQAWVISPKGRAEAEFEKAGATVIPVPAVSLYQNIRGLPVRGVRWGTVLRATWQLRYGGLFRRAIHAIGPDLVHLNDHGMFQAAVIAHRMGKPVVMHVRAVADRDSWWQNRLSSYFTSRYVDQVIAIDESVLRSIGRPRGARIIYNPLESLGSVPAPSVPQPGASTTFSFLAGLSDFKGVGDLLDCATLLRDRKDIHFCIYGENRWPREYYRSPRGRIGALLGITRDVEGELRNRIERESLHDTVHLMGHVPAGTGVFAATDVVVFPSRLNGVGRSVFEGGRYGIPSIVTLRDRTEDIIHDGVTGFIVPERNPRELAGAVRKLADDPSLRHRLGENARARYSVQFDPLRISGQVLEIYRSLLGRPR